MDIMHTSVPDYNNQLMTYTLELKPLSWIIIFMSPKGVNKKAVNHTYIVQL